MSYVGEVIRTLHDTPNVSNIDCAILNTVPVGHTIILAVNAPAVNAITNFTATDTKGNTWTQRAFQIAGTVTNGQIAILTCQVTTELTTSDTVNIVANTRSPGLWMVIAQEFSDLTGGFDVSASATNTNTTPSATTAIAAQNKELVFGAFAWAGSNTLTAGSGFSDVAELSTSSSVKELHVEWKYVDASGTRTANGTLSSTQWVAAVVAMKQVPLTASAGVDQAVDGGDFVSLTGSGSPGSPTISWAQLSGTAVTLGGSGANRTFTAPNVDDTLTFQVTADDGVDTATDTMDVVVTSVVGGIPGTKGDPLVKSLNRIAGTTGLEAAGAANAYAGTTGLDVVGALNVAAGNTLLDYKELQGVLNQLAGTTGLGVDAAAAEILA